jgi:nicotinamide mononucleotide (NMN) deamidase PncC
MEDVLGQLLRLRNKTVAVYEDVTSGQLSERIHRASSDHFLLGLIGNGVSCLRALLASSRHPDRVQSVLQNPTVLTEEAAWAVRKQGGSDLGVALHAVPDPNGQLANMSLGQTYITVTDGEHFLNQSNTVAGRSTHDRSRMTLAAVDLIRQYLESGQFEKKP